MGHWLEGGRTPDGSFEARAADGSQATGSIGEERAAESVALVDGRALGLDLARAALPAGLHTGYGVEDGDFVAARTIVLPDGSARRQALCERLVDRADRSPRCADQ